MTCIDKDTRRPATPAACVSPPLWPTPPAQQHLWTADAAEDAVAAAAEAAAAAGASLAPAPAPPIQR